MRKSAQFLIAVALACAVWLLRNLSVSYSDVVSVPVSAVSNIDGRARVAAEPVVVSARCRASGYRLLDLRRDARKGKVVEVNVDPTDFVHQEGDYFLIDESNLSRYSHDIYGEGVSLQSFVSPNVRFRFQKENCKRVAVKPVKVVEYRSEYTAMSEMKMSPDSVLVYGDPMRLESVESVFTKNISLKNVRNSVHGVVKLEVPSGTRLSSDEATYSLEVTRYVEIRETVRISPRNFPSGRDVSIYPSTAEVVYRCVFPLLVNPSGVPEFYVDYKDFENSINGKCVVKAARVPSGVISWSVEPQVCDCVLNLN